MYYVRTLCEQKGMKLSLPNHRIGSTLIFAFRPFM